MRLLASAVPLLVLAIACRARDTPSTSGDARVSVLSRAAAAASDSSKVEPLRDEDYVLAGVSLGADSAFVVRLLGAPALRVGRTRADTIGPSQVQDWHYRDVVVTFAQGRVLGITLLTGRYAAARGVRVGDQDTLVRAAYGGPFVAADTLQYTDGEGLPCVGFVIARGRVVRIVVFLWE